MRARTLGDQERATLEAAGPKMSLSDSTTKTRQRDVLASSIGGHTTDFRRAESRGATTRHVAAIVRHVARDEVRVAEAEVGLRGGGGIRLLGRATEPADRSEEAARRPTPARVGVAHHDRRARRGAARARRVAHRVSKARRRRGIESQTVLSSS